VTEPIDEQHPYAVTLVISVRRNDPPMTLYCEPEGSEHAMSPGDTLTVTFRSGSVPMIDVSPTADGLVVWRPTAGPVSVEAVDQDGNAVDWVW
jgi:hypothetical protein